MPFQEMVLSFLIIHEPEKLMVERKLSGKTPRQIMTEITTLVNAAAIPPFDVFNNPPPHKLNHFLKNLVRNQQPCDVVGYESVIKEAAEQARLHFAQ